MIEGRGVFFDPELLDLFLDNLGVFVGIKEKYRDSGEEYATGVLGTAVPAVPGALCS